MSTQCPLCHSELYDNGASQTDHTCNYCGASLYSPRSITIPYAILLTEKSCDVPRVSCPYCGAHYALDYLPHQGLIGCQECLKIFASPIERDKHPSSPKPSAALKIPKLNVPAISAPSPAKAEVQTEKFVPDVPKAQAALPTLAPATAPEPARSAPEPIAPVTAKKSKGKKVLLWIIAVILLLAIGVGAFFFFCPDAMEACREFINRFI